MNKIYGYMRVSSKDQNEDRQRIAMQEHSVPEENLYLDIQSGKDFNRPEYKRLVKTIQKNDILFIKSIDRLGRNYNEIIEQWRHLTKTIGADIFVIDMPMLDTRIGKDLMGTFISDIFLQVLSFVAENERANIKQRQAEGIAAAKARGVVFGHPEHPLPPNFREIYDLWKSKRITGTTAAKECNMPYSTFRLKAKVYEQRTAENRQ